VPTDPGSIAFASGTLTNPDPTGDFRVARLAFCAVAPGDTLLHWQFSPPDPVTRNSDVVDANGTNVANRALYTDYPIHVEGPSSTATVTTTPTPSGIITGHLTWQGIGQPDSRNAGITGTLTLCVSGLPQDYTAATDASGTFTLTTDLPPGTYAWHFKGRKWLASNGTLSLSSAPTNQEFGTQRAGDANNTNLVDSTDFVILKTTFGKHQGDPGYDERGDLNNDTTVGSTDFALLRTNFGFAGPPPNCP
jgi:hypothetical protein